jgi:FMN phosphatase YigB (HAD superfamily)
MKKIIFDLDDTLYHDEELRGLRETAILEFLKDKKENYKKLKENGKGTIESFRLIGLFREDFFKIINRVPINISRDDKLIELLKKLKKNYQLIVVSNSPKHCVKEIIQKLGIIEIIDKYYYGENFNYEKPNEECFFMVRSGDICVGNSFRKDLEVPKAKGAVTILIGKEDNRADFSIKTIYEMAKIPIFEEDLKT